jgi:hypothetical protein
MIDQPSFLSMRGMDILIFLRDSLADEAERKRLFIEQCEEVAGGVTAPEDKQRVRALAATAQALQYLVSFGQEELERCKRDKKRVFPEWITRCANQARNELVEPVPDVEDVTTG